MRSSLASPGFAISMTVCPPSHEAAYEIEKRGAKISGVTRSAERAAYLREIGFDVFGTDGAEAHENDTWPSGVDNRTVVLPTRPITRAGAAQQFIAEKLSTATHFLSTVSPDRSDGDPILLKYRQYILGTNALAWLGYLSSTSVYGEHDGAWVSETTEPVAPGQNGSARLAAESDWRQLATELAASMETPLRFNIFRLAGIYGPGRSAIDTLLRRPVALDGGTGAQKLTSRVHVDDIVDALTVSAFHTDASHTYNLADDLPATRAEVFDFSRQLIRSGAAGPSSAMRLERLEREISAQVSAHGGSWDTNQRSRRSLERASKRVSNARLKGSLLPRLQFPTYRHGLVKLAADRAATDPMETRLST